MKATLSDFPVGFSRSLFVNDMSWLRAMVLLFCSLGSVPDSSIDRNFLSSTDSGLVRSLIFKEILCHSYPIDCSFTGVFMAKIIESQILYGLEYDFVTLRSALLTRNTK